MNYICECNSFLKRLSQNHQLTCLKWAVKSQHVISYSYWVILPFISNHYPVPPTSQQNLFLRPGSADNVPQIRLISQTVYAGYLNMFQTLLILQFNIKGNYSWEITNLLIFLMDQNIPLDPVGCDLSSQDGAYLPQILVSAFHQDPLF